MVNLYHADPSNLIKILCRIKLCIKKEILLRLGHKLMLIDLKVNKAIKSYFETLPFIVRP